MGKAQSNVTEFLINRREGDEDAPARLMPLVYEEVRRLAQPYLQGERPNPPGESSALVREAYLHLVDDNKTTTRDRAYFYGIATRIVRTILVDHARAYQAAKAGGLISDPPSSDTVDLIALDRALEIFAQTYPRKGEVVELKFFGGLDIREISEVLEVAEKMVLRDWNFAKLWLRRALSDGA